MNWLRGNRRRLGVGALSLTLLAVGAWAWNSSPLNLKDRLFPKHLAEVEPGRLYRSGQIAANLIRPTLEDLKIDLILDLSHDRGGRDPAQVAEKRAAEALGIERVNVPLRGSGLGSVEAYSKAVATLALAQERGQRVLVHCRAGDRRTGGVLAAYELLVKGGSAAEARRELERYARRSPDESGLVAFLDRTLPEVSVELERQGFTPTPATQIAPIASSRPPEDRRSEGRVWLLVGLAGQLAFGSRFLLQWLASERAKASVIPIAFWWLSLAGSALLLAYAIVRQDPVFILGQSTGSLIYLRNLVLLRRHETPLALAR